MTLMSRSLLAASLLALAACAGGGPAPAPAPDAAPATPSAEVSPEATRLIAEGDAEAAEAAKLRDELRLLVAQREALAGPDAATRAQAGATGEIAEAGQVAMFDRLIAEREAEAEATEARARTLWQRAASIDPDAQDAILRRLQGTRPTS